MALSAIGLQGGLEHCEGLQLTELPGTGEMAEGERKKWTGKKKILPYYQVSSGALGVPLLSTLGPTATPALCAASASLSSDTSVSCSLQEAACP